MLISFTMYWSLLSLITVIFHLTPCLSTFSLLLSPPALYSLALSKIPLRKSSSSPFTHITSSLWMQLLTFSLAHHVQDPCPHLQDNYNPVLVNPPTTPLVLYLPFSFLTPVCGHLLCCPFCLILPGLTISSSSFILTLPSSPFLLTTHSTLHTHPLLNFDLHLVFRSALDRKCVSFACESTASIYSTAANT